MFFVSSVPNTAAWAVGSVLVCVLAMPGCDRGAGRVEESQREAEPTTPDQKIDRSQADQRPATAEGDGKVHSGGDVRQLLRTLDIMAAANSDPEVLTNWAFSIQSGDKSIDDFLDVLVESPGLGVQVAPSLIFGAYLNVHNYYVMPTGYNLKQSEPDDKGRVIHFIREPCKADEAVSVEPWWALDTKILVCPDTYRPERWTIDVNEHDYKSRMPLACDSQVGSPEKESKSICGCGPNLIRCMPGVEQYMEHHASIKNEVRMTTAHVVENDMPLDQLFVGNETFRDRRAEFLYRRRRVGALKISDAASLLKDLAAWPDRGKWAPRSEVATGEHAGVLTSHQLLNWSPDRRQRQRQIFEIMWCAGRNSFGATTQKIFEVSQSANLAFVHDSWQKLAHMEFCTNCHARLDYGFQYWLGYPDARAGTHYVPELQAKGEGEFYGEDIQDLRGKAQLTPASFARMAIKQPEFEECMTKHVVNYVLGDRATPEDRATVRRAFAAKHSFKEAVRVAMGRYAWYWLGKEPSPLPSPKTVASQNSSPDKVKIGSELRERIDESCVDCHDKEAFVDSSTSYGKPFDLRGPELARELVVRMTDHVAYRKMPKDEDSLSEAERIELVDLLISTLWSDDGARREARSYYLGQMRSMPAHQIDVAIQSIDFNAGHEPGIEWGLIERALYSDQALMTPGYLATTALEALIACSPEGQNDSRVLLSCLERTFSISRLSRWPE